MRNPVEQQLQAFNDRDLESFLDAYAKDVRHEDGEGNVIMNGTDEMRRFYGAMFSNSPKLHCDIGQRIRVGDWVIDEEEVTGVHAESFPEEFRAAVAYQVKDGAITLVRLFM